MIQVTNAHRPRKTSITARRDSIPPSAEGADQVWGSWCNDKHYSLDVIQQPIRARMCGFGDKDRRPLAPAAVAKMIVTRADSSLVELDDIDPAFFIVTVDLWSADGKQEMNLVLHPAAAAERFYPTVTSKKSRRGNTSNTESKTPVQSPLQAFPPPAAAYTHTSSPSFQPGPSEPAPFSFSSRTPYYSEQMNWGHPNSAQFPHPPAGYPGHPLPPIYPSFNRLMSPKDGQASTWQAGPGAETSRTDPPAVPSPTSPSDSETAGETAATHRPFGTPYGPPPPTDGGPLYAMHPYGPMYSYGPPPIAIPLPPPSSAPPPVSSSTESSGGPSTSKHRESLESHASFPRHSYTRTLVGPLSANAARLNDEHRKPGIFFLFQDLSIRTEGTFRLRLRLMNIGAFPAPDPGANRVMTTSAPILAQVFTEPFTVYSAKRFPGVPDTTALSIAFGNQGQKLPLRNRHRSVTSGRRRRRDESDDDESD